MVHPQTPDSTDVGLVSTGWIAERLGQSTRTVIGAIERGELPGATKPGRDWKVPRAAAETFLARHRRPSGPVAVSESVSETGDAPLYAALERSADQAHIHRLERDIAALRGERDAIQARLDAALADNQRLRVTLDGLLDTMKAANRTV